MKKTTILFLLSLLAWQMSVAQENKPVLRFNFDMHFDKVENIDTDSQGKYLLSASKDKTAKLWDTKTGELLKTYRVPFNVEKTHSGKLYSCAISPNAEIVAVGGRTGIPENRTIYIFNTQTEEVIDTLSGLPNTILDIEFSRNGKYLAAAIHSSKIVIYKTNLSEINNLSDLDSTNKCNFREF